MNSTTIGKYRWRIVALLFFATTINYIDRQVLSFTVINEDFQREILGLAKNHVITAADDAQLKVLLGYVDAAFKIAYALGFLLVGWFIDRVGTRKGFSVSMIVWSVAGMVHGLVSRAAGLVGARFMLGLGEAGNFPAAVKTIAEWFPRKERSFATGIMNAGANVGVIATALAVPFIIAHLGWRASFVITGALGLVLLVCWRLWYNRPRLVKNLSAEELAYIESDPDGKEDDKPARVSWLKLFRYPQTWAFALPKFLTDCVWYFFLTWLPLFFAKNNTLDEKLDLKSVGIPFLVIYIISDLGSIFFGWLTSTFMKKGWSANKARKTTLFICGLCALPIFFAAQTNSLYVAIALIALGTAAHQGFSSNILAMVSDIFPKKATGSVTGIGGMMGGVSGALVSVYVGHIDGYMPIFIYASTAYLLALLVIHLCVPKMQQAAL
ncbi:ACS family hexuronate transporter-like MFS transporter [Chitinophaga skermanii]|uniref:ACS family hexuronate transporter-like MFS transporter n=1 Tax=Chitinophaga skermanii TaxID=331697 RepID=A0A327R329_9BACT|nr:MFS transporter [Chitinophaga skermanii]RAJ11051.1 ACS family hexuronate transporter-like MFS transporter [Chitinophaga skermanii]